MSARRTISIAVAAMLVASLGSGTTRVAAATDSRLVVSVGVLPQFEQFIGDDDFPTELFGVEFLRSISRRDRGTIRVQGRRDLLLIGAGIARDVSVSSLREWRVSAGVDVVTPLGNAHDAVVRWHDGSISILDRLALRVGMGQTFDFARSRVGLRVGYDLRLTQRGSVLSVLEGLDDEVGDAPTFVVHEVRAAIEFRLGGNR